MYRLNHILLTTVVIAVAMATSALPQSVRANQATAATAVGPAAVVVDSTGVPPDGGEWKGLGATLASPATPSSSAVCGGAASLLDTGSESVLPLSETSASLRGSAGAGSWCVCVDIWIFCGCIGTTCDDGFCV